MATKEDKQRLIDTLKFTPRTYRITMWGYGGEKVMGVVDPKTWDYCRKHRVDLVDLAWGYDYGEDNGLDEEQLPFTPGSWYECDNMGHVNGVSRTAGTLQIIDENDDTVFEKSFDDCDGGEGSPQWSCQDEVWVGMRKKGEIVFIGSSNEKGTFFEGDIHLRAPFDIEKLELYYDEIDGEEIINCAYYDGEEVENWGGSTDGKSSNMDMVRITDDAGNWERYELPDEKESAHETGTDDPVDFPESGCNCETWNPAEELEKIELPVTDWFPSNIKPVHTGEYQCEFTIVTWPWPAQRMCEWTGRAWKDSTGERVKGDFKWRGLREKAE